MATEAPSLRAKSKQARRAAQRFRGFPLVWSVQPAPGSQECQGPTRRKRDSHLPWVYLIGRPGDGRGSNNSLVCANCCTFQEGKAIEWAAAHGGRAESFR